MSLDNLLQEAVTAAIHLGAYRFPLHGGLIIELRTENDCILHLTISRANQLPSIAEWETVIKYWPWVITAKPQVNGNSFTASIVIHPKYIQLPLDHAGHLC